MGEGLGLEKDGRTIVDGICLYVGSSMTLG